jgi:pimeloyl-ACP methyl ester carboxylesterase
MKLHDNAQLQTSKMRQRIQLVDGRTLTFDEYGTADGFPVVYMHGTPGARIEWLMFGTDDMACAANVRLIVPDRPGIGLSQFQPERKISGWPDDVRQLADHLGLERFAVLGISGGCPYVLACAVRMPERIASVGVVSGIGPHNIPGLTDGMNPNALRTLHMSVERPAVFRLIWWIQGLLARLSPRLFAAQAASVFTPVDQQFLHQHDFAERFVAVIREALLQGTKPLRQDVALMVSPWDFDPHEVRVPVVMWQGGVDTDATPAMARYLTEQIPHARLTFLEEEGHISLSARHMPAILSAVVAAAQEHP